VCTVTVHRSGAHLLVTMNRDEARDRAPEKAPIAHRGDIAWLAPSDSRRGGTWIAVNEYGVVACLMNRYLQGESASPAPRANPRTRGAIVPWLMVRGGAAEIRSALEHEFDPAPYPSFTVLLAHRDAVESFAWHGGGAFLHEKHADNWSVFSSSSWRTKEVIAWRTRAFDAWRAAGCAMDGALPALHLLQPEHMSEWSPLMDRERTCTRSITQIEIAPGGNKASMRYWRRGALDAGDGPILSVLPVRDARKLVHHG
jgi:hypothetical protein